MTIGRLDSLIAAVEHRSLRSPRVSAWSVGQQIEHCSLSMVSVCDALIASTPPMPRPSFSLPRLIVMTTGWIPRGKAKAPDSVIPSPGPAADHLLELLHRAEDRLADAHRLDRTAWFGHPMMGPMNRNTALRFLDIHNRHHLVVIADILRSARRG